jgi:hypothetical protein
MGFVVDNVALMQVSGEHFGFPCQFSFHRLLHTHLPSGTGTVGQILADVPIGLSLTPLQENKRKKEVSTDCNGNVLYGAALRYNCRYTDGRGRIRGSFAAGRPDFSLFHSVLPKLRCACIELHGVTAQKALRSHPL